MTLINTEIKDENGELKVLVEGMILRRYLYAPNSQQSHTYAKLQAEAFLDGYASALKDAEVLQAKKPPVTIQEVHKRWNDLETLRARCEVAEEGVRFNHQPAMNVDLASLYSLLGQTIKHIQEINDGRS